MAKLTIPELDKLMFPELDSAYYSGNYTTGQVARGLYYSWYNNLTPYFGLMFNSGLRVNGTAWAYPYDWYGSYFISKTNRIGSSSSEWANCLASIFPEDFNYAFKNSDISLDTKFTAKVLRPSSSNAYSSINQSYWSETSDFDVTYMFHKNIFLMHIKAKTQGYLYFGGDTWSGTVKHHRFNLETKVGIIPIIQQINNNSITSTTPTMTVGLSLSNILQQYPQLENYYTQDYSSFIYKLFANEDFLLIQCNTDVSLERFASWLNDFIELNHMLGAVYFLVKDKLPDI